MDNDRFFNENRINLLRRAKPALIILVIFLIQNTAGLFPHPWGVHAMLLVPAVVCTGMFEREVPGMFFGLFAGILLDAFSAESLCFHSIALTLTGFFSGLLVTSLLRNNLKTSILLSVVALLIYNSAYFACCVWRSAGESAWQIFTGRYLLSAAYTAVFIPVIYLIVRTVSKKNKT
ncbi:MAG: rod shape-determining protein MreD [Clostridia bacterium]|nr:rod shape-determining protein MreD [Clostridia bacterium]